MKTMFALGALALLLSTSLAVALDPITIPDATGAAGGDIYLVVDETGPAASVWQESNTLPGLQTEPTVLEDGTVIPADSQLA